MHGGNAENPAWRWARRIAILAAMVIVTAVTFGPSGGFHHHIGFGWPIMYMVWNGEDPNPDAFQIDGMEVILDPPALAIQFFMGLMIIGFGAWMVWGAGRSGRP